MHTQDTSGAARGFTSSARAFWSTGRGGGDIRAETLREPGDDDVVVRTRWSGVSRGTEATVFHGRVPRDQFDVMRAPHQAGGFPGPVKYGYLNVGVVEQGPSSWPGRTVFGLVPHQTRWVLPAADVVVVPDGVPARRAVLAGTVETAVNALWDAPPLVGDRVAVVGAGMVGCCVARLLARMPGVDVVLVDVDPARETVAAALGARFATPAAPGPAADRDLVVHTSATSAGLQTALALAAAEATVLELSWYGDRVTTVHLGGAFHSRRLDLRASQVGAVAPLRRARRTTRDRLALALDLLRDDAFDAVLAGRSRFEDLPTTMTDLCADGSTTLCHTIDYGED